MPILVCLVLAGVPIDARLTIEDMNQKIGCLMVTKRYDALGEMALARFLPEFLDVRIDGRKHDLLKMADGNEWEMKNVRDGKSDGPIRWRTRLDGWSRKGDVVTVVAHHAVVGEWLKDGRRMPVRFQSAVRETWVRRGAEWKALRFDELWVRGAIDGKAFPPKA